MLVEITGIRPPFSTFDSYPRSPEVLGNDRGNQEGTHTLLRIGVGNGEPSQTETLEPTLAGPLHHKWIRKNGYCTITKVDLRSLRLFQPVRHSLPEQVRRVFIPIEMIRPFNLPAFHFFFLKRLIGRYTRELVPRSVYDPHFAGLSQRARERAGRKE